VKLHWVLIILLVTLLFTIIVVLESLLASTDNQFSPKDIRDTSAPQFSVPRFQLTKYFRCWWNNLGR